MKLLNTIVTNKLDPFTSSSVLGSLYYMLSASAIKTAIKLVPDLPEEASGIDGYNEYFATHDHRAAEFDDLRATLGAAKSVGDVLADVGLNTDERTLDTTLGFMTQDIGKDAEADASKLNGKDNVAIIARRWTQYMRECDHPVPLRDFVHAEIATEIKRRDTLRLHGEAAITLLNNLEPSDRALNERLEEMVTDKALAKLHESRSKKLVTMIRYPQFRAECQADLTFIDNCIHDLGGVVPVSGKLSDEDIEAQLVELGLAETKPPLHDVTQDQFVDVLTANRESNGRFRRIPKEVTA